MESIRLSNVMASFTRTLSILYFCLRVLFFAMIASPALAQEEQSLVPPALAAPVSATENKISVVQKTIAPSSATTRTEKTLADSYWLVSTRRSVQTIYDKSRGSWHLDVIQADRSGASTGSNLNLLSTQLVPGVPVCIFAHGSFVTWESQARQAARAFQKIRWASRNAPLQMIFFTWPSDGPYTHIPQVDVSVRGKRAEFNGFHLATLISTVPESCPVTLIGHSHGARVALAAMQLGAGGSVQGYSFTRSLGRRRMRVVLVAGAMDHNWLNPGQRYGLALNRVECLLNLRNQNDLPLALYPLHRPFARRAVARSGLTARDTASLGPNAAKIRQVDVTNRIGRAHNWPFYYDDPQVLATIVPYLVSF